MRMAAEPWIRDRLIRRGVFEDGGKWKADLHGEAVGEFKSKVEALKAYRKAAFDKFGEQAALPTDEDIDEWADKVEVQAPEAVQKPAAAPPVASPAPKAPEPKKPASAPPRPAAGHPASTRGKR